MVRAKLIERASPIVALGQTLASDFGLVFGGIDLSPAPLGEDSIVSALELCGYGPIGSSGTVAVAAALTSALKRYGVANMWLLRSHAACAGGCNAWTKMGARACYYA